jgi:hypothetical protein
MRNEVAQRPDNYTPRPEAEGFDIDDWKSTSVFVIPVHAEIQALSENLHREFNLRAGLCRHHEVSLRLKARAFNHPE